MKPFQRKPAQTAIPPRPAFPLDARLTELRKRQREVVALIIEAEQSGAKGSAYSADDAKVEREARALLRSEGEVEKPPAVASVSLNALRHKQRVIELALQRGTNMLTEQRSAYAAQLLMERRGEYETSVRHVALAVAALKQAEESRQALLAALGAAGRNSGLPCANLYIAAGLTSLKTFTTAALCAGLISKEEI